MKTLFLALVICVCAVCQAHNGVNEIGQNSSSKTAITQEGQPYIRVSGCLCVGGLVDCYLEGVDGGSDFKWFMTKGWECLHQEPGWAMFSHDGQTMSPEESSWIWVEYTDRFGNHQRIFYQFILE